MLLLVILCVAIGIAGYRQGLRIETPVAEVSRVSVPAGWKSAPIEGRDKGARDRRDKRDRLKSLLAQPEASRQASLEAWSIIRGMTMGEVNEALADARSQPDAGQSDLQIMMLYFRWAQLDPEAAIEASLADRNPGFEAAVMNAALTAWMKRDPEAAYRFAVNNKDLAEAAPIMLARLLVGGDMSTALEKADQLGGDLRKRVIKEFATAGGSDEASRRAFLEELVRHGTEQERTDAASALVLRWSENDPGAALTATGELEAASKSQSSEIFRRWMQRDPSAAMVWSVEHPGVLDDAARVTQYERLTARDPAKAAEALVILETQPGFMEEAVKKLQVSYDREGWTPYGNDSKRQALTTKALRTHFQRWQELDPMAASAWKETLPARLRENLTAASNEDP